MIEKDDLEELKLCLGDMSDLAVVLEEIQEDFKTKNIFRMF